MNKEDIIRMAREAGLLGKPTYIHGLEAFAALVAKHTLANIDPSSFMTWQEGYEAGKQAEREACAKLCETLWDTPSNGMATEEQSYGDKCAESIRARGQE